RESPSVVSALYREQAARFNIDLIRGELLPTVQLEANYARRFDPSPNIEQTESATVTGRLTVPFYTGGEVEARVRQGTETQGARGGGWRGWRRSSRLAARCRRWSSRRGRSCRPRRRR